MPTFPSSPGRFTACARCKAAVIKAVDDGVPLTADPVIVTLAGEVSARRAGRLSYDLVGCNLIYRCLSRIQYGKRKYPVLISHLCGYPIPYEHRQSIPAPIVRPKAVSDGIPF